MWWRHVPAGVDPLSRPLDVPAGRWQRAGSDGLYLADSEQTVWAEWYRLLAELAVPPHRALPRDLWRFRLDVEVADLSSERRLRRVGLERPRPTRAQWAAFQAIGEALAAEGWPGVVAPSASRPEGLIVCLFAAGPRVAGVRRVARPRTISAAPAPREE